MYKEVKSYRTGEVDAIIKINENGSTLSFSTDLSNEYYIEYLKWLSEGNEPLPADGE
jgi:hypothetical protein